MFVLASASAVGLTSIGGCFGSFALTRKLWTFNDTKFSNKWVKWLIFLLFSILPVYMIGAFIDAIALNSYEFWTGKQALAKGETKRVIVREGESLEFHADDDGALVVRAHQNGEEILAMRLLRQTHGVEVQTVRRQRVAAARGTSTATEIVDANGHAIAQLSDEEWMSVRDGLEKNATIQEAMQMGLNPLTLVRLHESRATFSARI